MGDFAYSKSESLKYIEVINWCNSEYKNTPEKFKAHFNELDAEDLSVSAQIMCKDMVKNNLRSPSTADFPWFDYEIYKKGKWRYIVKSYVDGQNAYGATIRNNWYCDIQYKGVGEDLDISNWKLYDLEFE